MANDMFMYSTIESKEYCNFVMSRFPFVSRISATYYFASGQHLTRWSDRLNIQIGCTASGPICIFHGGTGFFSDRVAWMPVIKNEKFMINHLLKVLSGNHQPMPNYDYPQFVVSYVRQFQMVDRLADHNELVSEYENEIRRLKLKCGEPFN